MRLRRFWWRTLRRYSGEICDRCGRPASGPFGHTGRWPTESLTYWFAPNDLWNEVEGGPTGIRCPRCFTADAEAHGTAIGWVAGPVGDIEDWVR